MLSGENKACSSALDLGFFIFFKKSLLKCLPIIWMDVKDSMTSLHQKQTELCARAVSTMEFTADPKSLA